MADNQLLDTNISTIIKYLSEYRVALCVKCKVGVPRKSIESHLRVSHKKVTRRQRYRILQELEGLSMPEIPADFVSLPDGSAPLAFLNPPKRGFYCPDCPAFRTISPDGMRRHLSQKHPAILVKDRTEAIQCFFQKWTVRGGAGTTPYWIVSAESLPEQCCNSGQKDIPVCEEYLVEDRTLTDMEAEEERRICQEGEIEFAVTHDLETDENTDWLRGCGWPRWFKHKPTALMVTAAMHPSKGCPRELFLGRWNGLACRSSVLSEKALQLLVVASRQVLSRCQETLSDTPRVFCCWLRSWSHSYSPYPFQIPSLATVQRYSRIWISCVCYIIRMRQASRDLMETTSHLCGLSLTDAQISAIDDVWKRLTDLATRTTDCSQTNDLPEDCLELLFQLFVTLWTDIPRDGSLEGTAIAHFSGVLGIHPSEYAFRTAYSYTPFLSALIWVGRLVILEYALPKQPYRSLPRPWPSRDTYPDMAARLCGHIRPKYLQRGSISPIGYLLERLQHGRAIAKRDGAPTNISWSLDGQTIGIGGSSITVPQFRHVIHCAITRAQQQLDDLLFDWWPDVQLDRIRDDMSIRRPGYSFLADPMNNLQSSFRTLSKRAFSEIGKLSFKGAGRLRVTRYLRGRDQLVRHIFAVIYSSAGMPPRGEELRFLRWANTAAAPRNIFMFEAKLILVFPYNKAGTNHNNSFYVVRRPCPAVERILYIYLVYIRPFCDLLNRELTGDLCAETNKHLFTRHDQETACFSSSDCAKSLQSATLESPIPLNLRVYRQIAVAMSKKHIPAMLKPFDAHAPNDYDGFLKLLAFQTGHKPATHAGAYALENAFPSKLQPDLIHRYLANSDIWHEFAMIGQNDYIGASVDGSITQSGVRRKPLEYFPDLPKIASKLKVATSCESEHGSENEEDRRGIDEENDWHKHEKRKHVAGTKRKALVEIESPTSKRLRMLQDEIQLLLRERQHRQKELTI